MREPSGETAGLDSALRLVVSFVAPVPSAFIVHTSPLLWKATLPLPPANVPPAGPAAAASKPQPARSAASATQSAKQSAAVLPINPVFEYVSLAISSSFLPVRLWPESAGGGQREPSTQPPHRAHGPPRGASVVVENLRGTEDGGSAAGEPAGRTKGPGQGASGLLTRISRGIASRHALRAGPRRWRRPVKALICGVWGRADPWWGAASFSLSTTSVRRASRCRTWPQRPPGRAGRQSPGVSSCRSPPRRPPRRSARA